MGVVLFCAYFLSAARPIPLETVMIPRWLNSTESGTPVYLSGEDPDSAQLRIPFTLGNQFGFVGWNGHFSINQTKEANVSLSPERWAEYEAEPENITVFDSDGETLSVIERPNGYPFFLDNRTFIINSEQNAVSEIDNAGAELWTYEFASPLTCVDSAAGLVLTGSLDGVVAVLDNAGKRVFAFEPGGSRYSVILGCAISRDGSRIALISGLDDQRFLLLERFGSGGGEYKVVYHEFLGDGFRRPVHITFVEGDRWIAFERDGGLGLYEISSRKAGKAALNGTIEALDNSGGQEMVFAIVSRPDNTKVLAGIRLPGRVIIESAFKSDEVFLGRMDARLIVGGGQSLASFDLGKR